MADQDIAHTETASLISSDKVEGTPVYNGEGERLGSISSLMVNKRSGHVEYAVLTFGGVLGLGADHYPLPWESLIYDTRLEGYVVNIDRETIKSAPHFEPAAAPDFDHAYAQSVYGHYGLTYSAL
ncbi:MAG TPA: PRC-barrel domain-containing protein [Caulobacteraceae bacterium]|nr:PRC-barrel domain-containing protein [Caulobacteraceae bacterium]